MTHENDPRVEAVKYELAKMLGYTSDGATNRAVKLLGAIDAVDPLRAISPPPPGEIVVTDEMVDKMLDDHYCGSAWRQWFNAESLRIDMRGILQRAAFVFGRRNRATEPVAGDAVEAALLAAGCSSEAMTREEMSRAISAADRARGHSYVTWQRPEDYVQSPRGADSKLIVLDCGSHRNSYWADEPLPAEALAWCEMPSSQWATVARTATDGERAPGPAPFSHEVAKSLDFLSDYILGGEGVHDDLSEARAAFRLVDNHVRGKNHAPSDTAHETPGAAVLAEGDAPWPREIFNPYQLHTIRNQIGAIYIAKFVHGGWDHGDGIVSTDKLIRDGWTYIGPRTEGAQAEGVARPAPSAARAFCDAAVQRADTARTEYLRDVDANDQMGALTAALEAIGALTPPIRSRAIATLHEAAAQFAFYADQHFEKTPPDEVKGRVNQAWSDYCFGVACGMDVEAPDAQVARNPCELPPEAIAQAQREGSIGQQGDHAQGKLADGAEKPRAAYTAEKDHAMEQIVLHLKRFNGLHQSEFWMEVHRTAFPATAPVWPPEGCRWPETCRHSTTCQQEAEMGIDCPHAKRGDVHNE